MLYKKCPAYGKKSYSSADRDDEWVCPYCQNDLSEEPIQSAGLY